MTLDEVRFFALSVSSFVLGWTAAIVYRKIRFWMFLDKIEKLAKKGRSDEALDRSR